MKTQMVIERLLSALMGHLRNLRLRQQLRQEKIDHYDQLVENLLGLRRAIETQERAAEDLHKQLEQREKQILRLKKEYAALRTRRTESRDDIARTERLAFFKAMQTVLTQVPTMRAAVESGAEITARDVLDLLSPVDGALEAMGFQQIGTAGQEVTYDPRRHKAVGRGARAITPDDRVRIRYVGYTYGDEVVCKAQVTRSETQETQKTDAV